MADVAEVTMTSFNDSNQTSTGSAADDAMFAMVLNCIVVPVLFGLITIVGLAGNGLVIYVIVTKRRMRTVTNLLLLNLAIADLCFVIVIPPFTAYMQATASWPFGDVPCRLLHYLVNVTAYVTVYTLVLIAALRYATIVHSTSTVRYRTRRNVMLAVGAIWVLMLLVNSPILASYGVVREEGFVICDINADNPRQVGQRIFATFFAFGYVLPLSVIAIFSLFILRHLARVEKSASRTLGASKQKRHGKDKKRLHQQHKLLTSHRTRELDKKRLHQQHKLLTSQRTRELDKKRPQQHQHYQQHKLVTSPRTRKLDKKRHAGRMLVLVVVLFALLWLPIHIHLLDFYFDELPTGRAYMAATVLFSCLAYFNSCVNPIIYNHASKEFRDAFLEVARCGRAQPAAGETAPGAVIAGGGNVIALADTSDECMGRQGKTVNVTSC